MKAKLLISLAVVICLGMASLSCTSEEPAEFKPPSPEELADLGMMKPEFPRITEAKLRQMLDDGEPVEVVNTDSWARFDQRYLPGSLHIPGRPSEEITRDMLDERLLELPEDKLIAFW